MLSLRPFLRLVETRLCTRHGGDSLLLHSACPLDSSPSSACNSWVSGSYAALLVASVRAVAEPRLSSHSDHCALLLSSRVADQQQQSPPSSLCSPSPWAIISSEWHRQIQPTSAELEWRDRRSAAASPLLALRAAAANQPAVRRSQPASRRSNLTSTVASAWPCRVLLGS